MDSITETSSVFALRPALSLIVIMFSTSVAVGQPNGFVESFNGPIVDPAWNQNGDPNGHPASIAGTYEITDAHGQPGTTLNRSTGGTVSSFTHEIDVVLNPHLLTGSGGTQSDIKLRSVGANGILDVVFNSFGHVRVDHNDFMGNSDHIAGAHPNNISIGYADGDALNLKVVYDNISDTIDVTYALNSGPDVSVYSGGGIVGPIGDVVTTAVEFLVFKFGDGASEQTLASIDSWSLTANTGGIPGDFNSDGRVDGIDFLSWQQNPSLGILSDWESNYGTPVIASSISVPEPSTVMITLFTASLGLSLGTSRKKPL